MGTTHTTVIYGDTAAIKNMLNCINARRTAAVYDSNQCVHLRAGSGRMPTNAPTTRWIS